MRRLNKVIATTVAVLLLSAGTLAWQSFSQLATNETIKDIGAAGGRLHDYFDGTNKDVFVENYASGDNAPDIYARIRLSEYFEYGRNAGALDDDKRTTVIRGDIQGADEPVITEKDTWDIYDYYATVESMESSDLDDTGIREYRKLNFGGGTTYLPTFNQDNTDLTPDINGTLAGTDGDGRENISSRYDNYVEYDTSVPVLGLLTTDQNIAGVSESHTPELTNEAEIMTMNKWLEQGGPIGEYWVFDKDGWAYYAAPIKPQTATGLLLDNIEEIATPKYDWYYAVDVKAQLATAGDWGTAPDDDNDGTGMYDDELSGDGLGLLDKVSGRMRATNLNILKANGEKLEKTDLFVGNGKTLELMADMDILFSAGFAGEKDVLWTIEEVNLTKQSSGLSPELIEKTLIEGEFKPVEGMVESTYKITATSVLTPTESDSIEVYVYDSSVDIVVTTEDDKRDVKVSDSLQIYAKYIGNNSEAPVDWSIIEISGKSGLTEEQLNTTVSETGLFKPLPAMLDCVYRITATTTYYNQVLTDSVDIAVHNTDEPSIQVSTKDNVSVVTLSTEDNSLQMYAYFLNVSGTFDRSVKWTVSEVSGASGMTSSQLNNTISEGGIFDPVDMMSGGVYRVTATSTEDSDISGYKDITVSAAEIQLNGSDKVNVGSSITLSETVTGLADSSVTWSISKKSGDSTQAPNITTGGTFIPVEGMGGSVYTVTARSVSNTTVFKSIDVTVTAGSIDVESSSDKLTLSSQAYIMQMSTTVNNIAGNTVTWSIAESGTSTNADLSNAISTTGLFTATDKMSGGTFRITATSAVDGTVSGYKDITINEATITLSGANTVYVGKSLTVGTTVTGLRSDAVTWTIAKKSGSSTTTPTITSAGVFTPVAEMDGSVYTITAKATSNNNVVATRDITVIDASVTVTSDGDVSSMTLSSSAYTLQMSAAVYGFTNTGVTWSIAEQGTSIGASLSGVINTSGLLTVTDAMAGGTYRITATSTVDTSILGYKDITIAAPTLSVSRSSSTVNKGSTVTFTANVSGLRNTEVTWSRTGQAVDATAIDSSTGVLTIAGTETSGSVITAKATLNSYTSKTATNTVTVNTPAVTVTSSAASITLTNTAYTMQMSSGVTNLSSAAVTWSVAEQGTSIGANVSEVINTSGLLTVTDAMAGGTYRVTATASDGTTGYKDITIAAPILSVSRSSSTVNKGSTVTFTANVSGLRNTAVTWTRTGQAVDTTAINSSTGVLTIAGTETSGRVITAKATLNSYTSKTAANTVTVNTPTLTVTGNSTINKGASTTMSASTTNLSASTVTWSITSTVTSGTSINASTGVLTIAAKETSEREITVKATSTVDTNLSTTKIVTVNTPAVTVTSSEASMTLTNTAYTMQMSSGVTNLSSTAVTWSVAEQGTSIGANVSEVINTSGLLTVTDAMAGGTYRVTATASDGTTGYKDITIAAPILSVSRSSSTVNKGSTVTFTANVSGLRNTAVTWSRTGQAVDATAINSSTGVLTIAGTETNSNVITAKATLNSYTSKTATNTVTVNTSSISLKSTSTSMTLSSSAYTATLTPTVSGTSSTGVTYAVTRVSGSDGYSSTELNNLMSGNTFTATDLMTGGSYKITATSTVDTNISASVTIAVKSASISLARDASTVDRGNTVKFTQTVTGLRSSAVTWSRSGYSSSSTTVSGGTLTVASTETVGNTITVTATSSSNTSVKGSNTVTVTSGESNVPGYTEDELLGYVGTDNTVIVNGQSFYVIHSETLDGVTAIQLFKETTTGTSSRYGSTNTYSGSTLAASIATWYNSWFSYGDLKSSDVVSGTDTWRVSHGAPPYNSYASEGNIAFALSYDEFYTRLKSSIRSVGQEYWLRTPATGGTGSNLAYTVSSTGYVSSGNYVTTSLAVRPSVWIYVY